MLAANIIIIGFIGLKISVEIWERRRIEFYGLTKIEINDAELKSFILKGEKIKATKRYRIITGNGFKESIRYVDLFSKHYLK